MPYISTALKQFERKIKSQFGEDGVLLEIAKCLGIESGTFFEFGIGPAWLKTLEEDGLEGNFVYLKSIGWRGVFLDINTYPLEYEIRTETVTALNINILYEKHSVPKDLDMMSIDVDGQEFWIWMSLQYQPKVIISEYNGSINKDRSVTMPFNTGHRWNGMNNNGSSLLALNRLAQSKSYTLVYANGVNAIFIRSDLVSNRSDFSYDAIYTQFVNPLIPDDPSAVWVEI